VIRDQLAAARRRDFIGRRAELALFERLLDAAGGAVVYVHGTGGIGKSSLLHQYAWLGERHERQVVRFDAAGCGQSADSVEAGLAHAADVAKLLLLIDGADRLAPLDRWLREEFLVRLPGDAIVVLAGRNRPALGWRTDPGWRSLLHQVPLRELDAGESRELLHRRGLPGTAAESALAFARGHPLALALAAELGPNLPDRPGVPDAPLRELLGVLLDTVPTPLHRAALEASSQVLVTTEPLLAALIGEAGLFGWLRDLPIVEYTGRGVRPHDLVRDLLAAELRWRDPAAVARLRRRAREFYLPRLDGGEPVLFDLAYLHRDSPLLGPFLSCVTPGAETLGDLAITPMRAGEWPALRTLLVRHEGEASAALADRWAAPETVSVVRDGTDATAPAIGFMLVLWLERLDPAARAADPATAAAWRCVAAPGPALYLRCWLDGEHYQAVSPAQTRMIFQLVRLFLSTPGLTYTFLPVADPQFWASAGQYIDLHRLPAADFEIGGRRYGMYAHDWHAVPPAAWLQRLAEREPTAWAVQQPAPGMSPAPGVQRLDDAAFAAAVRDALRELGRPDRLAENPLAAGAAAPDGDRGAALERSVRNAAAVLRESARDRRAYRALHHTYLQPAGTQQRAAELLDLPISTYRRHLAEGIARLTALLRRADGGTIGK